MSIEGATIALTLFGIGGLFGQLVCYHVDITTSCITHIQLYIYMCSISKMLIELSHFIRENVVYVSSGGWLVRTNFIQQKERTRDCINVWINKPWCISSHILCQWKYK